MSHDPSQAPTGVRPFSITFWHVLVAFVPLAITVRMVRTDALVELRGMAADIGHFATRPLLLDAVKQGYGADAAQAYLAALGERGRGFLADSFYPYYDLAFPMSLLVFAVVFVLFATQPGRNHAVAMPDWLRLVLLGLPGLLFCLDLAENLAIKAMLESYPRITTAMAETASQLTQLKWAAGFCCGIAFLGLLACLLYGLIEDSRRPGQPTDGPR